MKRRSCGRRARPQSTRRGVDETLRLRSLGLDYSEQQREAEVARNLELFRQAGERLMNAGGPKVVRSEMDKLAKDLGV